jgi:hypothetical protein
MAWPPSSSSLVGQVDVRQWPGLHAQVPWLLERQKCGNGLASNLKFPCWSGRRAAVAWPPRSRSLAVGRHGWGNCLASKLKFPGCWTGRVAAMTWPPSSRSLAVGQTRVRQWPGLQSHVPWQLDRQGCGNGLASTLKFSGCWTGRFAAMAWPSLSSSLAVGQTGVRQWPGLNTQVPWLLDRQKCGNGLAFTLKFPGC